MAPIIPGLMMARSFTWLLFVLGLALPSIAALLLSATPHPSGSGTPRDGTFRLGELP